MKKSKWTKEDLEPQICVAAIVRNGFQQEILVQKHKKLRKWTVPMGKCKPGQSKKAAIKRELKEECGIDIVEFVLVAETEFTAIRGEHRMKVPIYLYDVLMYKGEVQNLEPEKHIEQKFIDPRKLKGPITQSLRLYMLNWFGRDNYEPPRSSTERLPSRSNENGRRGKKAAKDT
jgi:8-oxo-dGTP pyrophosphatase MutT (NUDIX family)